MNRTPFRVDILNTAGSIIGPGPLTTVLQLNNTVSLDRVGELTFTIPAGDERAAFIAPGCQFDVFDEQDGYLGRYLYSHVDLSENTGEARLQITANDQLRALGFVTVGFSRKYSNTPVASVLSDLALQAGWGVHVLNEIGNTSVTFEGESVQAAIDLIRDNWGQHYRLGALNTLDFGTFGSASGVRLTNLAGQIQPNFIFKTEVAIPRPIRQTVTSDEIVNRVIALGAGQGTGDLTMAGATAGTYPLKSALNQDGTSYYYIEDTASIALYGLRTKVVKLTQVRPISGSKAALALAANTLKLIAEAYMARHLKPIVTYDVEVQMLRQPIKVGDTVRLSYRGVTDSYVYLDVEDDFYVMDATYKRSSGGGRSAKLTISSISDRRTSDTDVMVDVVRDVSALKIHVQPTGFVASYSATESVCATPDPSVPYTPTPGFEVISAEFHLDIPPSVPSVTSVLFRMQTKPLESPVGLQVYGGSPGTTQGLFWALTQSRFLPYKLRLFLDDVEYTDKLGGPWATSLNAVGRPGKVNVLLDLTDIVNALPVLQGEHIIRITPTYLFGYFEIYPGANGVSSQGSISYGRVRGTVTIQGTCMPIIVT